MWGDKCKETSRHSQGLRGACRSLHIQQHLTATQRCQPHGRCEILDAIETKDAPLGTSR